jgi:hypothetical protein
MMSINQSFLLFAPAALCLHLTKPNSSLLIARESHIVTATPDRDWDYLTVSVMQTQLVRSAPLHGFSSGTGEKFCNKHR